MTDVTVRDKRFCYIIFRVCHWGGVFSGSSHVINEHAHRQSDFQCDAMQQHIKYIICRNVVSADITVGDDGDGDSVA